MKAMLSGKRSSFVLFPLRVFALQRYGERETRQHPWCHWEDDLLTMQSGSVSKASEKLISVCVVGAGAAGLCFARHLAADPCHFRFDVYEQGSSLGGTWVYTDETAVDENGIPIHSSMYKNLRTNILQEIMGFPDFPFPDAVENSYPSHEGVLAYLQSYADNFSLRNHVQFQSEVKIIRPVHELGQKKWAVTVLNYHNRDLKTMQYDAVAICNGHYAKPSIPEICDLEMFEGEVLHSHEYRRPDSFRDLSVAVFGAGASGRDVAIDVASYAAVVYLCHAQAKLASRLPSNVEQRPSIVRATKNGFILADDTQVQVDALVFCTGYKYHFPFLHPSCRVQVLGRRVRPLYKHVVNIEHTTLCFIGIPFIVVPFPMFHFQSLFFIRSLLDSSILPSKTDMYEDEKNDFQSRLDLGFPPRYAHKMGDLQWKYNDVLAELAGVRRLHQAYKEMYQINTYQMKNFLMEYKKKNYSAIFREKLNE